LNGRVTVGHKATETELADLRAKYVPRGITSAHPVTVDRAQGSEIWDISGKRYIDFAGGIGVMNVGHAHPHVMKAVREQLDRATHTSFQVVHYESYLRLAERLCEVAPIDGPKKAIFFSTGAEAIENAVKIARAFTGRPAVISFRGGFHGRTLLALTLTGSVQPYKQDFGPYATEIYQTPFPYAYRGWTTEAAMADLENLLESEVSPKRVAAIVIEPVLGEGGFVPAPLDFMRKLRELCDRHGMLLIVDEIQTGFGRTGKMFCADYDGVNPDLYIVGKALGGGVLPVSGVLGKRDTLGLFRAGDHGSTFGGNPLACAVGLAALDVIVSERLPERALETGTYFMSRLRAMKSPLVQEVRGKGLLIGVEIKEERGKARPYCEKLMDLGILAKETHDQVIRFAPPLVITREETDWALERIAMVLA